MKKKFPQKPPQTKTSPHTAAKTSAQRPKAPAAKKIPPPQVAKTPKTPTPPAPTTAQRFKWPTATREEKAAAIEAKIVQLQAFQYRPLHALALEAHHAVLYAAQLQEEVRQSRYLLQQAHKLHKAQVWGRVSQLQLPEGAQEAAPEEASKLRLLKPPEEDSHHKNAAPGDRKLQPPGEACENAPQTQQSAEELAALEEKLMQRRGNLLTKAMARRDAHIHAALRHTNTRLQRILQEMLDKLQPLLLIGLLAGLGTACNIGNDCTISAGPEDGLDGKAAQSNCPEDSHCFIDDASVWREVEGQKGVCVEGPPGGVPRVAHWSVQQPFPQLPGTPPPPQRPRGGEISPMEPPEGPPWTAEERAQYETLYLRHLGRIHTVPAEWPSWEGHREAWQVRATVEGMPADEGHLLEAWYALPGETPEAAKAKPSQKATCKEVERKGRYGFEVVCEFSTLPKVDGPIQVYVQSGFSRRMQDNKPLRLGVQHRLYSVAVQPPQVRRLEAFPTQVLAGDTLTVCLEAEATAGVRTAALHHITHGIEGTPGGEFTWEEVPVPKGSTYQQCKAATVPLNTSLPPLSGNARRGTGAFTLNAALSVADSLCEVHHPCTGPSKEEIAACEEDSKLLSAAAALCNKTYANMLNVPTSPAQPQTLHLQRLTCETERIAQFGSPVSHPPAWASECKVVEGKEVCETTIVFGGKVDDPMSLTNSLFFLNTSSCTPPSSLHSGPLQGPPVSLPSTGKIGVALGGGAPPNNTSKLTTVSTRTKNFVDTAKQFEPGFS